MGKVLSFPGSGGVAGEGAGRRPGEDDRKQAEDERLDGGELKEDAGEGQEAYEDGGVDLGPEEEDKERGQLISFADAARAEAQARQDEQDEDPLDLDQYGDDMLFGLGSLRGGGAFEGSHGAYMSRLMDALEHGSRWSKKGQIMSVLRTLQRGSASQVARNVALRRDMIKEYKTEELADILEGSKEPDWTAQPSYYQAVIQELDSRDYRE